MISLMTLLREAQSAPKAVILAGAPGAGKSSIVGDVLSGMGLTTLNIDDDFIKNLKDADVSLDLKNADAEDRSKAAKAMQAAMKSYQERLAQEIGARVNIIIDGTAASYKKTEQLKDTLENAGYEVFMVFVYSSLEKSLRKNEDRFERSMGEDRSLMPSAVYRTWLQVYKNFDEYKQLFGDNFVSVANIGKSETIKDIEKILQKYIDPFKPSDAKPKTEKEQAKAEKLNKELNQQMEEFLNSNEIKNIIDNSVSKEQAQQKITNFINK